MDEVAAGVFVVTLEAVENGAAAPRTILAFVVASSARDAEATARREAARDGFTGPNVLRTAEVVDAAAVPDDFRPAMASARRYGSWLIVYEDP
ncbi:MAG TPA: hypothetical protein VJU34_05705 [Phenylobacterium sp.]|nr:hypothetical protein [Phenylobacterium sp.]